MIGVKEAHLKLFHMVESKKHDFIALVDKKTMTIPPMLNSVINKEIRSFILKNPGAKVDFGEVSMKLRELILLFARTHFEKERVRKAESSEFLPANKRRKTKAESDKEYNEKLKNNEDWVPLPVSRLSESDKIKLKNMKDRFFKEDTFFDHSKDFNRNQHRFVFKQTEYFVDFSSHKIFFESTNFPHKLAMGSEAVLFSSAHFGFAKLRFLENSKWEVEKPIALIENYRELVGVRENYPMKINRMSPLSKDGFLYLAMDNMDVLRFDFNKYSKENKVEFKRIFVDEKTGENLLDHPLVDIQFGKNSEIISLSNKGFLDVWKELDYGSSKSKSSRKAEDTSAIKLEKIFSGFSSMDGSPNGLTAGRLDTILVLDDNRVMTFGFAKEVYLFDFRKASKDSKAHLSIGGSPLNPSLPVSNLTKPSLAPGVGAAPPSSNKFRLQTASKQRPQQVLGGSTISNASTSSTSASAGASAVASGLGGRLKAAATTGTPKPSWKPLLQANNNVSPLSQIFLGTESSIRDVIPLSLDRFLFIGSMGQVYLYNSITGNKPVLVKDFNNPKQFDFEIPVLPVGNRRGFETEDGGFVVFSTENSGIYWKPRIIRSEDLEY